MSEEQWNDFKNKLTLGFLALVLFGPLIVGGPLLPKVLDQYRKSAATDPKAPERFYQIGKLMMSTFREEQGLDVLREAYILFSDDHPDGQIDFSYVAEDRRFMGYAYLPWLIQERYTNKDPELPRPKPVQVANKEVIGKILATLAKYYEDEKQYERANHIFCCLQTFWPANSLGKQEGDMGRLRAVQRSF